ncbi:MAG: hypothetical protein ACI4NA_02645 [Succinivibrio sp.]
MGRESIEYYDLNLRFYLDEVKAEDPSKAGELAQHVKACLDDAVRAASPYPGPSNGALRAALSQYLEVKKIVSPILPGYFDDSDPLALTSADREAFDAGFRELSAFIAAHPRACFPPDSFVPA